MTPQERRAWAADHIKRMAPFILAGILTLGVLRQKGVRMTPQERRAWAADHIKRMAPFILTGILTLGVNVVIQSSGVSESCQAEIKGYCARIIEKVIAKL